MTLRYPGAKWRPLPEFQSEPLLATPNHRPIVAITHSIVGSKEVAFRYFAEGTSLESHFGLDKVTQIEQWMEGDREADANYFANTIAMSCETGDNGSPDTDPWTGHQVDELRRWNLWCVTDLGVAPRIAPLWNMSGLAYHSMFGAPSPYTPAVGKTCPGRVRIQQWREDVVPWVLDQAGGEVPLTDEEKAFLNAMNEQQVAAIAAHVAGGVLSTIGITGDPAGDETILQRVMRSTTNATRRNAQIVGALRVVELRAEGRDDAAAAVLARLGPLPVSIQEIIDGTATVEDMVDYGAAPGVQPRPPA